MAAPVEYAPMDPSIAAHAISNAEQAVYLLAQLASREYVASVTLDEMLEGREVMAEKQAAANVILRREESASTRSMANAARVMAEEPTLMRLKELETLEKIAGRIHELRLVVGVEEVQRLLSRHTHTPPDEFSKG